MQQEGLRIYLSEAELKQAAVGANMLENTALGGLISSRLVGVLSPPDGDRRVRLGVSTNPETGEEQFGFHRRHASMLLGAVHTAEVNVA